MELVTLHVSVWVEIYRGIEVTHNLDSHAPRERVSWNSTSIIILQNVECHAPRERVSWNDAMAEMALMELSHAPRERVSWNHTFCADVFSNRRHAPRERVSWNLFQPQIPIIFHQSRSTWACELKLIALWNTRRLRRVTLHVSVWVEMHTDRRPPHAARVTLHVSVWVEIIIRPTNRTAIMSRSTWACELKCLVKDYKKLCRRHAPRERVSWN